MAATSTSTGIQTDTARASFDALAAAILASTGIAVYGFKFIEGGSAPTFSIKMTAPMADVITTALVAAATGQTA